MNDFMEKRECVRTSFVTRAIVTARETDVRLEGKLVDVSILGASVSSEESLPVGTRCELEIIISGRHSKLSLDDIHGEVVWQTEAAMGIRFNSNMEWFVLFKIYSQYSRNLELLPS